MKRKISLILSIFLLLQLCACAAKGPEPAAEGENTIIEISRGEADGDVNKLAASAVAYTDSFKSADGTVEIEIALNDPELLEAGFGPVRVRPRAITGEEAEHFARVLFGDAEMLDYLFCREYTKAELEEQRALWQELLAGDGLVKLYGDDEAGRHMAENTAQTIEAFLKSKTPDKAPESIERTACDFTFEKADGEECYEIRSVTEKDGIPYYFGAVNNTEGGIGVYHVSAYLSTEYNTPNNMGVHMLLNSLLSEEEPTAQQLEAAREKAEELIEQLDIGQWQIDQCSSRIAFGLGSRELKTITVTAVPLYNNIPVLRQPQLDNLKSGEEGAQSCYYQDLRFEFAPDGTLISFDYYTPMDIVEDSVDNARTLSFSELMGSVKAFLSQTTAAQYPRPEGSNGTLESDVVISGIQLGLTRQAIAGSGDYLLVPSVSVYGNYKTTYEKDGQTFSFNYKEEKGQDLLLMTFDAANGASFVPGNNGLLLG